MILCPEANRTETKPYKNHLLHVVSVPRQALISDRHCRRYSSVTWSLSSTPYIKFVRTS